MSHVTPARAPSSRSRRGLSRRATVWLIIVGIVVVLLACVAWVTVRALIARADLEESVGLATTIEKQIGEGDTSGVQTTYAKLEAKADSAHDLTSDPIWRAAEIVPVVGANLSAVRQISAVVAGISHSAIGPLSSLAGKMTVSSFVPVKGTIDLKPLVAARPALAQADRSLHMSLNAARRIRTTGTISPVLAAVTEFTAQLQKASSLTSTIDRTAELLPDMLGAAGPRNYLLLFQNNAEVRSSGGIASAFALVHSENGTITLTQQASSSDFPQFQSPVLPMPLSTRGLYGNITGEYVQDVTLTPQFPLSAQLAREMWQRRFGTTVDGVFSIDPVGLSYLLKATGPVSLPGGIQLTSADAVAELLSDTYERYPDPSMQDAFFASAAAAIFQKVASGAFDPQTMVAALGQITEQHRLLIWSAGKDEQATIDDTTLAGQLPVSTPQRPAFGIYFNDATGAKMSYYLRAGVGLAKARCDKSGRTSYVVRVTLRSTAPANASTALPPYVTGAGILGTPPGTINTLVAIYAPKGMAFQGAARDGSQLAVLPTTNVGLPLAQFQLKLEPGQSVTTDVQFLAGTGVTGAPAMTATPLVHAIETKRMAQTCLSALEWR